jgi:RNA polymerase sigma factor (sigma-70 family)
LNTKPQPVTPPETLSPVRPSDWTQATDSQLIEACLDGHEMAWAALIQRYSRLIYTIPLRFGFPKVIADEVFQETCLILLEGLSALQDRQRISSWLMTVTRRACIQRLRRRSTLETDELTETKQAVEFTVEEDLLRLEQQQLVYEALAHLPPRDQQLLRALFLEEPRRPYEEIARELRIPEGSIGPLRARSLKKLRQEIIRLEQS